MNILIMCYTIVGFHLLKSGTMAMYTLFLMSGGMVAPYVFGLLFLDEPFLPLRMAALILILSGIVLSNVGNKKTDKRQLILCIAVFILNGFASIVSKLHQIEPEFKTLTATEFVMLGGFIKFVFGGALYCTTKKQSERQISRHSFLFPATIIFCSALAGGTSYLMQLHSAAVLPATVLYPFITGGSVVFSSLAGVFLFRERLSKNLIMGIILCFLGTIMFL